MANYFSQYQGGGPAALPPGYMQAATAPGRYLAEGFESLGNSISEGLEKYRKNKEKREILTEKGEFVAQQKMQDLASWVDEDPQRADTPEYEQKLKDVQKFSEGIAEMPLGKLESAISNYSLEQEIEGRRFAQDIQARQLGIAEGNRADAVEDRRTKEEKEAAFVKGLQLLGQVPTTKTEESPGYYGYAETPQQPATPAAVEPNPNQSVIDEVNTTYGSLPASEALTKSKTDTATSITEIEETLKSIGASKSSSGEVVIDPTGPKRSPLKFNRPISGYPTPFTPQQKREAAAIDKFNEELKKNPDFGREKTIDLRIAQKKQAEELYAQLEAARTKQTVLNTLGEEDLVPTLPPVRIEMPEVEPEYKFFPPTTETRDLTPQERYSQIQKITAEYGPQMGAEMLGKFRNITTQYDPNAPSPIRETEGPSGQKYFYNVKSTASGVVPNKNTISSTERATDKRIAFNKAQAARKEQSIAKRDLGKAIDELEALKADPVQEEGKIKAAEKKVARLRAELDEATDLGTYDPLTGELK